MKRAASQRAAVVSCQSQRNALTTLTTSPNRVRVKVKEAVVVEELESRLVVREVVQSRREKERRSREERSGWRRSSRPLVILLREEPCVEKRGERRAEKKVKTRFKVRESRRSKKRIAKRIQPRT